MVVGGRWSVVSGRWSVVVDPELTHLPPRHTDLGEPYMKRVHVYLEW